MGILIYRRQRVDYGEQEDTTCLVSQFTSYVAGPSEICPPRISMERSRTASPVAVLQRAKANLAHDTDNLTVFRDAILKRRKFYVLSALLPRGLLFHASAPYSIL